VLTALGLRQRLWRAPFLYVVWTASYAWFALLALRIPLDEDEGFYALASELVAHGRLPYRDFFFPQTPLGPLSLAPFAAVAARFVTLRLVTALFAAGAATLVAYAVKRETRSRAAALVGALLFVTHALTWRWLPTLRPYALGELCALGGFVLATPIARDPTRRELLLAGALAVLAPLARLPLAPTLGIVALAVLLRGRSQIYYRGALTCLLVTFGAAVTKHPVVGAFLLTTLGLLATVWGRGGLAALGRVGWFALGGAALGALVIGPFLLLAKEGLVFGVVDYHALSSQLVGWPRTKPLIMASIGGGAVEVLSGMGTQNVLLLLANLAAVTLRRPELRIASLTGAAVIVVGSARHEPVLEHYLTPIVPYLAIGAGVAFGSLQRLARGRLLRPRIAVFGGALVLFLAATAATFDRTFRLGMMGVWDFSGARPGPTDDVLEEVRAALVRHPGSLLAYWPGTALGSATRLAPGYENQFTRLVADKLPVAKRERLHLTSEDDLTAEVMRRGPSVVVVDRGTGGSLDSFRTVLGLARYEKLSTHGATTIYVRAP
jgi:hypothetical protein